MSPKPYPSDLTSKLRTDSASLRFFRQRIASFLSPRTDIASLRLVAEAIAVRDTRALVRSRSSVACVRAGDYAGNLTNWWENTRLAARPPASGATRPRRSRPAMQAGTATSRRRRCRLRPTFKGVMRCRMESPSDEAMRCRFAQAMGCPEAPPAAGPHRWAATQDRDAVRG